MATTFSIANLLLAVVLFALFIGALLWFFWSRRSRPKDDDRPERPTDT